MEMTGAPHVLTDDERVLLDTLEAEIERGEAQNIRSARAMGKIRDRRLYREHSPTFKEYCRERWDISHKTVEHKLRSVKLIDDLRRHGLPTPRNLTQARQLQRLGKEELREALSRVEELGGFDKIGWRKVQMIAAEVAPSPTVVTRRADMVLVTKGGKVGPSTRARSRIIRGLRTIAEEADALQALGPYAIADMLASMSESESSEVRELALKGCRLLQRFNESWLVGRDDPAQPQDGQQDISTLGFLAA